MFNTFKTTISNIFHIPELRTKLFWTLGLLLLYRLGSHIPIPGIDTAVLKEYQRNISQIWGGALTVFSTISGGAIGNCALFSLGIMPYISASIIFSLLTKVVPKLEALSKEGQSGQRKINEYTRLAAVPICIIQSYFIIKMLAGPQSGGRYLIQPADFTFGFILFSMIALTGGTLFLMWLSELITDHGLGNGASMLIMAGILADLPTTIQLMFADDQRDIFKMVILFGIFILIVSAVVLITQGQRRIPVQQAKHTRGRKVYGGQKHYMPLRVNQAGVMPVIFASSLLIVPTFIAKAFGSNVLESLVGYDSFFYILMYCVMIFFFSFFWTNLMFAPLEMANQMKEHGSFIPGIRPGKNTSVYLEGIVTRITFVGAIFLAMIALMPQLVSWGLGLKGYGNMAVRFLGGTGLLIVVGVALDVVQKVESHLLMRNYHGFVRRGRIRGRR
ncbi:MAG: preprotein translocase subunit SecY [Planctomycetota bacterium]